MNTNAVSHSDIDFHLRDSVSGEPGIIFHFDNDPLNNVQNTTLENIKRFKNHNQISKTMSQETCWRIPAFCFVWYNIYSNILKLWENQEEFWNEVFCNLLLRASTKWGIKPGSLEYTLPKKKCNFQTWWRNPVLWIFWVDMYSNILRLWEDRGEFWNKVLGRSIAEIMHDTRFTKIHSSPKETQFSKPAFLLVEVSKIKKPSFSFSWICVRVLWA